MKKIFIKTRNVRNFIGLVEALKSKPKNIPKMGHIWRARAWKISNGTLASLQI